MGWTEIVPFIVVLAARSHFVAGLLSVAATEYRAASIALLSPCQAAARPAVSSSVVY